MARKADVADSKNSEFEFASSESKHCFPIVVQAMKRLSEINNWNDERILRDEFYEEHPNHKKISDLNSSLLEMK